MDENHTQAVESGSQVFQSWLTQWKITVVSAGRARQVLAELVNSHSQSNAQHPFWVAVSNYMAQEVHPARPTFVPLQDTSNATDVLATQIDGLDASSAKRLLQFMATVHDLTHERTQFWQIASDVMSRFEAASAGQRSNHRKPQ